jgi:hypothetical protein
MIVHRYRIVKEVFSAFPAEAGSRTFRFYGPTKPFSDQGWKLRHMGTAGYQEKVK